MCLFTCQKKIRIDYFQSKILFNNKSYDELPKNAKKYIARVEDLIGAPVGILSVGPDREQTIFLS